MRPDADPIPLEYVRAATSMDRRPREVKPRRPHSILAIISLGMLFLSCAEDIRQRKNLPPGASSSPWGAWEGSYQLFLDNYSAEFAAALAAWGIVLGLVAMLVPRTQKWLALTATLLQTLWLWLLWKYV